MCEAPPTAMSLQDAMEVVSRREVIFKILKWHLEELDDEMIIHISGMTKDDETVYVKIPNYQPYVYLELPKRIEWTKERARNVFMFLKTYMKGHGPIKYKLCDKFKLHYKIPGKYLMLVFNTHGECRKLEYLLHYPIRINGFTNFEAYEFALHEQNIDPIIKFTVNKKIKPSGWVKVTEMEEYIEDREFSTCDIDMYSSWDDVNPIDIPDTVTIHPKWVSFDIETYSINHNSKLPDPKINDNEVLQISFHEMSYDGSGKNYNIKKHLLSLHNCPSIENVDVRNFASETDLLMGFKSIMHEVDPDILLSYNGLKFDWDYLISRAEHCCIWMEFSKLGRIKDEKSILVANDWESSAYGKQKFSYLEPQGRINIDLLPEIERNYKFDQYSLNAVSEFFLGEKKEDLSPKQLFKLYQIVLETEKYLPNINFLTLKKIKTIVKNLISSDDARGIIKSIKDEILFADLVSINKAIYKCIEIIGIYCVKDSILPLQLITKLNTYISLEQMSNITGVPVSYLLTRGQQIKVLAQVYRRTAFENIIIDFNKKDKKLSTISDKYQGASVVEANAGDYNLVAVEDFASLYPTTMITYNICYTTIVPPEISFNEEEMYKCEWDDHVGCSHDIYHRKKKKEEIMCGHNCYNYYKPNIRMGLVPSLLRELLVERRKVKKQMKIVKEELSSKLLSGSSEFESKQLLYTILDKRQLALKLSSNSVYGALGAKNGYMPLIAGAASVTAMGRNFIWMSIAYVLKNYPFAKLVYGDSVTGDTPILCMFENRILYRTIDTISELLGSDSVPQLFEQLRWKHINEQNGILYEKDVYEISDPRILIWTDKGFTPLKKIIRHKTTKDIYRILTHTGIIDATEDHSLLNEYGEKISPANVNIGDILLHNDLPLSQNNEISLCPYSMGLFYGDGSCGEYDCASGKKRSWAINNQNMNYLNEAKSEIEKVYENTNSFKILDTLESSKVYKLVACGNVKDLVIEWRKLFYDKNKYKKVPDCILNGDLKSRKEFFRGYYDADGEKGTYSQLLPTGRFDNKGKIGSAGLYYLASSLGYKVSINTRDDKTDIYRMTITQDTQRKNKDKIKKIRLLGKTERYVYDLETENHHFSAGIGRMIVHNTDSMLLTFIGKKREEVFDIARDIAVKVTNYLRRKMMNVGENDILTPEQQIEYDLIPMELEDEAIYGRYLLLTKKRYVGYQIDRAGNIEKTVKKGVVIARRDNCHHLRETYNKVITEILDGKNESEVMNSIFEQCMMLMNRTVNDRKLIIYKGIRSLKSYEEGKHDSHVMLARKMAARGEVIPPNTRLEYIFLSTGDPKLEKLQGNKAEDYTYYKDNHKSLGLKIDYLYYLEKQFVKPLTELINVKYHKEEVLYYKCFKDLVEKYMLEATKDDNEMIKRLWKIPDFNKRTKVLELIDATKSSVTTGNTLVETGEKYKKIGSILFKLEITNPECINCGKSMVAMYDKEKHSKLLDAYKKWRADDIICRIYKSYGITKKLNKRPKKGKDTIIKDGTIMKNYYIAHKTYLEVVKSLKQFFNKIYFV